MNTNRCKIINLPKIGDHRGNLSFVEELSHIPFAVKRTYWIYDVPGGEFRGGHAYRDNEEFIIALSGSFDVVIDDDAENRFSRSTDPITDFMFPTDYGENWKTFPRTRWH